jgi:hypothetical protein
MSDVTGLKVILQLIVDLISDGEIVLAGGSANLFADIGVVLSAISEVIADKADFALALSELKTLDAAGVQALVAELSADGKVLPTKVSAIINALSQMIAPIEALVGAFQS